MPATWFNAANGDLGVADRPSTRHICALERLSCSSAGKSGCRAVPPPANKGDRVALILALSEFYRDRFKNIRLFVLNPYDIVLSKLSRNLERERQDVAYLTKTKNLDGNVLQKRYEEELRIGLIGPPARHDQTLRFWSEAYFGASGKT